MKVTINYVIVKLVLRRVDDSVKSMLAERGRARPALNLLTFILAKLSVDREKVSLENDLHVHTTISVSNPSFGGINFLFGSLHCAFIKHVVRNH